MATRSKSASEATRRSKEPWLLPRCLLLLRLRGSTPVCESPRWMSSEVREYRASARGNGREVGSSRGSERPRERCKIVEREPFSEDTAASSSSCPSSGVFSKISLSQHKSASILLRQRNNSPNSRDPSHTVPRRLRTQSLNTIIVYKLKRIQVVAQPRNGFGCDRADVRCRAWMVRRWNRSDLCKAISTRPEATRRATYRGNEPNQA